MKNILKRAATDARRPPGVDEPESPGQSPTSASASASMRANMFAGTGYTLGSDEVASTVVANPLNPTAQPDLVRLLRL